MTAVSATAVMGTAAADATGAGAATAAAAGAAAAHATTVVLLVAASAAACWLVLLFLVVQQQLLLLFPAPSKRTVTHGGRLDRHIQGQLAKGGHAYMAVRQGSEQGQQSAEQAACECRSSCAGRLDMRSQGRMGGGLEGCNPSSVPCVIVILYLSFLFSFLVLEEVVGDFVVHEQKDYEMNAHVVLERVVDCGVTSLLSDLCKARVARAHAARSRAGALTETRAPRPSPFYPGIIHEHML